MLVTLHYILSVLRILSYLHSIEDAYKSNIHGTTVPDAVVNNKQNASPIKGNENSMKIQSFFIRLLSYKNKIIILLSFSWYYNRQNVTL